MRRPPASGSATSNATTSGTGDSDYAPLVARVLLYLTPKAAHQDSMNCNRPNGGLPPRTGKKAAGRSSVTSPTGSSVTTAGGSETGRYSPGRFSCRRKILVRPLNAIAGPDRGMRDPDRIERVGFLLLEIDPVYLAERMIPRWPRTISPRPNGEELYQIAVVEEDGAGFLYRSHDSIDEAWLTEPDLRAPLLAARPGDARRGEGDRPRGRQGRQGLSQYAGRISAAARARREVRRAARPRRSRRGRGRGRTAGDVPGPLGCFFRTGTAATAAGPSPRSTWPARLTQRLQLQWRRDLAVGSGVLLLLGAAMAMVVISSRRSRRLADMQMEFVAGVSP